MKKVDKEKLLAHVRDFKEKQDAFASAGGDILSKGATKKNKKALDLARRKFVLVATTLDANALIALVDGIETEED